MDFANGTTVDRRSLDLLVVDEAGQFSLAPTIAAWSRPNGCYCWAIRSSCRR